MKKHLLTALLVGGTAAGACADADESDRVTIGGEPARTEAAEMGGESAPAAISAEARQHLDAGNAAYRAEDYSEALAHYRLAARAAPENQAPLFGINMAATAMGDTELADSAKQALEASVPGGIGHP